MLAFAEPLAAAARQPPQLRSRASAEPRFQSWAAQGASRKPVRDGASQPFRFLAAFGAAAVALAVPPQRRKAAVARGRVPRHGTRGASRVQARAAADVATPGSSLSLFSPAKINLFLRVVARRPDGYHDLASLFQTVSLGDTLDMEVLPEGSEQDELQCNLPGVPVDKSNLVIRALDLFRARSGLQTFFRIRLDKSIPAQAGMGGGSSDAATAFYGANELCGRPATQAELLQWADDPMIGSDAAFFLSDDTAYCTGRGEIVEPVGPLPVSEDQAIYLVKTRYGLSTPKVFKALDLDSRSTIYPKQLLRTFQEKGTAHSSWVNDLEQPAFAVCPELGELKAFLAQGGGFGFSAVMMSGSGTTIFCLGEPEGGRAAFEEATRSRFDIEGTWRSSFVRRAAGDEWYRAPLSELSA